MLGMFFTKASNQTANFYDISAYAVLNLFVMISSFFKLI